VGKASTNEKINIKIAGEVFGLNTDSPGIFDRFKKFHPDFLTSEKSNFEINFSRNESRRFSYLIKRNSQKLTVALNNERLLRQGFTSKHLDVYVHRTFDLENFFRILLSSYLSQRDGLFLHASCVEHKGFAHLFSGPSGSGKSTIASLAGERRVLSDDLVLIRKVSGEYRAFATPFGIHSSNTANINLPIKALYLLGKAKNIQLKKISLKKILPKLISNLVYLGDRAIEFDQLFGRLINSSYNFLKRVPSYYLNFSIKPNLWRYL
jgi:hypothetical protein